MKKIFISLFFIFTIVFFVSCENNVEQKIVGKWTVKSAKLLNADELSEEMNELIKLSADDVEKMKEDMIVRWQSEFIGMSFDFKEDKIVVFDENSATWTYNVEKNEITIEKVTEKYILKIIQMTETELDAEMFFSDGGMDFEIKLSMSKEFDTSQ